VILQKQLYLESFHLIKERGWKALEEEGVTFFMSPVAAPFIDYVYGEVSFFTYQKAREFYGEKPFIWMVPKGEKGDFLLNWGFIDNQTTYEMELNRDIYKPLSSDVVVKEVESLEDYTKWIAIFAKWVQMDSTFIEDFFTPWVKTGKFKPYLGFYEGKPVTTAIVYEGSNAFIEGVGTLPEFRGKGIATAVIHACIKSVNTRLSLYSLEQGRSLYEKVGFKVVQEIREYKSPR
jgi:ribosomal protein S18 acetylase RimI-like enzyme